MNNEGANVGHGDGKARPDDRKNLICVRTSDEAYEELKGKLGRVFKQGLDLVDTKAKLVKGISGMEKQLHCFETDVEDGEEDDAEQVEECSFHASGNRVVLKKLLVLQKMQDSEVARHNKADECEAGKDGVLVVEEDDNVVGVRGEGGDTEEKECKWLEVPQFPAVGSLFELR